MRETDVSIMKIDTSMTLSLFEIYLRHDYP